jgi:hypothetical protein
MIIDTITGTIVPWTCAPHRDHGILLHHHHPVGATNFPFFFGIWF